MKRRVYWLVKKSKLSKILNIIISLWQDTLIAEILFFCFLNPSYAAQNITFTFKWEANTEPDVIGYYIYFKTDPNSYFEDKDKLDVNDPNAVTKIEDDPNAIKCEVILPELGETEAYFFRVTAYDNFNLESEFSNEVVYPGDYMGCNNSLSSEDFNYGLNLKKSLGPFCDPYTYTSFDLLLDFKKLGDIIGSHYRNPKEGSFYSTYWFFGQVAGEKTKLSNHSSEGVNGLYIIYKK